MPSRDAALACHHQRAAAPCRRTRGGLDHLRRPAGAQDNRCRVHETLRHVRRLDMATSLGAKASADSKRTLPAAGGGPRIVVVGLESEQPNAEDLRRAAGTGVRHAASLADSDALSVAVSLGSSDTEQLAAVAEGALLGSYRLRADQRRSGQQRQDQRHHCRSTQVRCGTTRSPLQPRSWPRRS